MTWDLTTLQKGTNTLGISLSQVQFAQFDQYMRLILEWNQQFNLTAITDPGDIQTRLFLDSISCSLATGNLSNQRVVDVGSGAGIPGIPLKILFPQMRLTLLESVAKKARFLAEVCREMDFRQVDIVVERAEKIGQDADFRESYDWAMARAVAPLNVLVEYLFPLCKVNGHILAQKGRKAQAEVETATPAIKLLGGGPVRIITDPSFKEIGGADEQVKNILVVISKIGQTPKEYPRRVGIPAKRPLHFSTKK